MKTVYVTLRARHGYEPDYARVMSVLREHHPEWMTRWAEDGCIEVRMESRARTAKDQVRWELSLLVPDQEVRFVVSNRPTR